MKICQNCKIIRKSPEKNHYENLDQEKKNI